MTADTAAEVSEDAEETEISRANIPDNLPEITFDGQEFRAAQQISNKYEFYSEELNGEGANDAVYNRNLKIEDRFDVKIQSVDYESLGAINSDVAKLVTSGTDAYEVASHCAWKSSTPIRAGVYRNWNEVDNVDFSQPWWNQLANESNTINGILYTATVRRATRISSATRRIPASAPTHGSRRLTSPSPARTKTATRPLCS